MRLHLSSYNVIIAIIIYNQAFINFLKCTSCVFNKFYFVFQTGHYSGWSYDEQYRKQLLTPVPVDGDEVYFCAYTPFMFAFVQLILTWVLLPLICGLCCCCACLTACCACCFKGNGGDGGGAVEPAKSESVQDKEMEA